MDQAINAASSGVTSAQVGSATAGLSAGAVGTYIWARGGNATSFGTTTAGSDLRPSSYSSTNAFDLPSGPIQAGTWRLMGQIISTSAQYGTLWLRIS